MVSRETPLLLVTTVLRTGPVSNLIVANDWSARTSET